MPSKMKSCFLFLVILASLLGGVGCGWMGPQIYSRAFNDTSPGRRVIVPGRQRSFAEDGKVASFEWYNNGEEAQIRLSVWTYKIYSQSSETHALEMVGATDLVTTTATEGIQQAEFFDKMISVKAGDIIAMEYLTNLPVNYDHNGATCQDDVKLLYFDFAEDQEVLPNEIIDFKESAENPCRTYSFRAQIIYESEACNDLPIGIGETKFVTSPGYNGVKLYKVYQDVCWLIAAPNNHVVVLNFVAFFLEKRGVGGSCYDSLTARDGMYPDSMILGTWCGTNLPEPNPVYGKNSRFMYLQFVTDVANNQKGFNITYTSIHVDKIPDPMDTTIQTTVTETPTTSAFATQKPVDNTAIYIGVGVGVGVAVLLTTIIIVVCCCCKKSAKKKQSVGDSSEGIRPAPSPRPTSAAPQPLRPAAALVPDDSLNIPPADRWSAPPAGPRPSTAARILSARATSSRGAAARARAESLATQQEEAPPPQISMPGPADPAPQQPPPADTLYSRVKTPTAPPATHLRPLSVAPSEPRPFSVANPRPLVVRGPYRQRKSSLIPIDLDPDTSRDMGTPLPYNPKDFEEVEKEQEQDGGLGYLTNSDDEDTKPAASPPANTDGQQTTEL